MARVVIGEISKSQGVRRDEKALEQAHNCDMGSDHDSPAPTSRKSKTRNYTTKSLIQKNAKIKARNSSEHLKPTLCHGDGGIASKERRHGEELPKRKARKRVLGVQTTNALLMPLGNLSENVSREKRSPKKNVARSRNVLSTDPVANECQKVLKKPESGEKVRTKRTKAQSIAVNEEEFLDSMKGNDMGDGEQDSMQTRQKNRNPSRETINSHLGSQHDSASEEKGSCEAHSLDYKEPRGLNYAQCHEQISLVQSEEDSKSILGELKARVLEKSQNEKQKGTKERKKLVSAATEYLKSVSHEQQKCSNVQDKTSSLSDEEEVNNPRLYHTLPRASRKKLEQSQSYETETDLSADENVSDDNGSGSDGLSDFIVSDSYISEEESIASTPPPPRSTRRLVRGRKPRSLDDTSDLSLQAVTLAATKSAATLLVEKGSSPKTTTQIEELEIATITEKFDSDTESTREEESISFNLQALSLNDEASARPSWPKSHKNLTTPPQSPSLKPVKLKSPTKKAPTIPTSPHKPSMDSFWDQEAINDWNDEYSPQKVLKRTQLDDSPVKSGLLFSPEKVVIKQDKEVKIARKLFEESKHAMAEAFLVELDTAVAQGRISKLAETTGGIRVIWSNKLNTTAGRANWKKETVKPSSSASAITYRHHATIELASKVISTEHRLLNVLAHEFCHLANFMISNVKTNPHGKEFKAWAAKCSDAFGDRGIEVTTKHSYEIDYKYVWECENCGLEFKRHSKSIDPARHRCGSCKATLIQTRPVPRKGTTQGHAEKKMTDYQLFVKQNMANVRQENPGSPQKELLSLVAKRYKESKSKPTNLAVDELNELDERQEHEEDLVLTNVDTLSRRLNFLDLSKS